MLRATWYQGTAQLLSLTVPRYSSAIKFDSTKVQLSYYVWQYQGTAQLLSLTELKSHLFERDSNPRSNIGGRLGKLTC